MASWTPINLGGTGTGGNGAAADLEQNSGDFGLETIGSTTFNGFRYDPVTGRLVVEQLTGDTPVSLPQETHVRKDDYMNWVFTRRTLGFEWQIDNPTHLLMEVS